MPLLETLPMNAGLWLAISRFIFGSACTKAAANSAPRSWLEVNTKALTLADAIALPKRQRLRMFSVIACRDKGITYP